MSKTIKEIKQEIKDLRKDVGEDHEDEIFRLFENNNVKFNCVNGCKIGMHDADDCHDGTYECDECEGKVTISL